MTVIATNVASLRAANAAAGAGRMQSTAMERLSTGKRINSAKDAEGALDEMTNMYQRIRELHVQKQNGTYSTADIANITAEQEALTNQAASILRNTKFNGITLFIGAPGPVAVQAGANAGDAVSITLTDFDIDADLAEAMAGNSFVADVTLGELDSVIGKLSKVRAGFGAMQNRLESAVSNLSSNLTNLSDARSRIEDADFSTETTVLARAQILSQASTAMLSQANQSQQGVLKLLQ